MQIIDNQEKFNNICKKLASEPVIFMDTEFHRRITYYAKLSVVQIASKEDKVIIDILAVTDLTALKELLLNQEVLKVFHAPLQDFEIFLNIFGKLPNNIFDTQIAAGVIGLDDVMGYSRLCQAMLNINLDKTMQKANWLERPLSKKLLDYAIKDVEYLIPLYRDLSRTISERNLWDTYKTRSQKLLDVNSYKQTPERIMKKMRLQGVSEHFQKNLLHFIMLREECAQELNIPRNFCANDKELMQVCERLPLDEKALSTLRIQKQPMAKNKFKTKLLELCSGLQEF